MISEHLVSTTLGSARHLVFMDGQCKIKQVYQNSATVKDSITLHEAQIHDWIHGRSRLTFKTSGDRAPAGMLQWVAPLVGNVLYIFKRDDDWAYTVVTPGDVLIIHPRASFVTFATRATISVGGYFYRFGCLAQSAKCLESTPNKTRFDHPAEVLENLQVMHKHVADTFHTYPMVVEACQAQIRIIWHEYKKGDGRWDGERRNHPFLNDEQE